MKNLFFALTLLVSLNLFAQAPANNNCANFVLLTSSTTCNTQSGTIANATLDGTLNASCAGTERADVWYRFVAKSPNPTITLTVTGANFVSPGMQLLSTNCNTGNLFCGTTSIAATGLTVNNTYYLRVYTTAASTPASNAGFDICITDPAPANDLCSNATNLTPTASCGATTGQTLGFATATGSPASPYGTTYDVWYRFTTPATVNTVNIALSGIPGATDINTSNNTYIEVFNANACGSVTEANSLGVSNANTGLTLLNAAASTQYYFRVFTRVNPTSNTSRWSYSICVSYLAAPANNECAAAIALTPGVTNTAGRVNNATASAGIPAGCASGTPDDDVWYSFVATHNYANVTLGNNSVLSRSGMMVQLFSGTCGALTPVACGQDALYATGLTPGNTYYARVYSADAAGTPVAGPSGSGAGPNFNIAVTPAPDSNLVAGRNKEIYTRTILSTPSVLADPWEVTYAPDGNLWLTESKGYKVFKINPVTGERKTVLDISPGSTFLPLADRGFNAVTNINVAGGQGGLAGMALHPDFLDAGSPKNFVYLSYINRFTGGAAPNGLFFTNRLVRFEYDELNQQLINPVTICDTLPGSSDHNSQRMIIAPVSGTDYLFYAEGDMGAGQFDNQLRPIKAQDTSSYEGKILRFNLEADGDAGLMDRWIPNNNPYNASLGVQSAVWCIGIRNNQGFAYDSETGLLYGSSHGPYSDDEINIIQRYKNYGHPLVIGFADDNNYANCTAGTNNTTSSCPVITSEITNRNDINSSGYAPYVDPLFSAYVSSTTITNIYTQIWSQASLPNNGLWPSEGWSGLDIYKHTLVPGWKNSLVAASLKWGRFVRIKLGAGGTTTAPVSDTVSYFGGQNRFRDLAFNPNGKDLYVVMDRSTTTSGPSNAFPLVPACQGCLQKYSFLGYADATGKSSIPASIPVTDGVVNTCNTGTPVTIDASNNNLWVPITGPDGNIMAEINAMGQNLGAVTSSFYQHSGSLRSKNGLTYLDRNITINPAVTSFGTPVKVRLYISKAEFDALDANGASGIVDLTSLQVLKNNDACSPAAVAATSLIVPDFRESFGANGYMLQFEVNSFSSFYFGSANLTLPLDLITFKGNWQQNNTEALLKWQTQNESGTAYFVVERSTDGITYSQVGTVQAAGNSNQILTYSLTDKEADELGSLIIYYRLRMVDVDGVSRYSSVVVLTLSSYTGTVAVSPNPATDEARLTIIAPADGRVQYQLVDNAGRILLKQTVQVKKGAVSTVMLSLQNLSGGVYYLHLTGAGINRNLKVQKF
ncbi:MAG: PQQ-dependent sugar dehydrogenase [Chitinophagales bacterium]|nr:PQQ-dependent sugar dehydrogenase [Chitinophagales bacterium]